MSSLGYYKQSLPGTLPFFKSWTPDMAYVLGLFFADGSITTRRGVPFQVTLELKDVEHVRQVAALIDPHLNVYVHRRLDGRVSAKFQIVRKEVVDTLLNLGLTPLKSMSAKWPSTIPIDHCRHFIRGYFDGDGTISTLTDGCTVIAFASGGPNFLTNLRSVIVAVLGIGGSLSQIVEHCWQLTYTKKSDVLAIGQWMYSDGGLRMARKYDRWLTFSSN